VANWHRWVPPWQALPAIARSHLEPLTPLPSLGPCFLLQPRQRHCPGGEGTALSFSTRWGCWVAQVHLGMSVRCCTAAQKLTPPSSADTVSPLSLVQRAIFGLLQKTLWAFSYGSDSANHGGTARSIRSREPRGRLLPGRNPCPGAGRKATGPGGP